MQRFRALVSGFSTLLAYDRLAEELAIDERLEAWNELWSRSSGEEVAE